MEKASFILELIQCMAIGCCLSWLKALTDHIFKLRQQVGTLDRPHCNFIKGYKKQNHFKDEIETR
jgi:hypothetical protein